MRSPLPSSSSSRTLRQLPPAAAGETFPGQRGALATCSAPAAFLAVAAAAACPGTGWSEGAAALARGSGLGAGAGARAASRGSSVDRSALRPPRSLEPPRRRRQLQPPARPPAPPPSHRSVPPSPPRSLPFPNLLPASLQSPPPPLPLPWRPPRRHVSSGGLPLAASLPRSPPAMRHPGLAPGPWGHPLPRSGPSRPARLPALLPRFV